MQFFAGNMLSELPIVVLITGAVLVGLWISNIVYDHGVPHYISRKIGHGAGGLAFLSTFVLSSSGWPIILAISFGMFLLFAHFFKPDTFRGVGGTGRNDRAMSEVWFAWIAVPVFLICWFWLDKPTIAVTSLLFMAWGDGVTGLVRSQVYQKPVKGLWGSLAMFCVCLIISWVFIKPYWIGVTASITAVVTEWAFGDCGIIKWADDNWAIPLASMGTILGLMALVGDL